MKKMMAIAFVAALAASCSKKDSSTESNVMLEEPKVEAVDSAAAAQPVDQTTVANDSAAVMVDSAAAK